VKKAADRPMLHSKHDQLVQDLLGDTTGKATYRALEDLTDSDDAAMEISGESGSESAEPAHKRARTTGAASNHDQDVPKWSNPDPYTALPPPDETQRKKKDVVQLIRKARVEAETKPTISSEAADFISFDFSDNESEKGNVSQNAPQSLNGPTLLNAPKGPRGIATLPPRPPPIVSTASNTQTQVQAQAQPQIQNHPKQTDAQQANKQKRGDLLPSTSLGSRKRNIDDEIKRPPAKLKKATKKMKIDGLLDAAWRVQPNEQPCPWVVADHAAEPNMALR
jgi:non-canonical poly(A) RNA polymerase PAPD5/7